MSVLQQARRLLTHIMEEQQISWHHVEIELNQAQSGHGLKEEHSTERRLCASVPATPLKATSKALGSVHPFTKRLSVF